MRMIVYTTSRAANASQILTVQHSSYAHVWILSSTCDRCTLQTVVQVLKTVSDLAHQNIHIPEVLFSLSKTKKGFGCGDDKSVLVAVARLV